jgi:hypothetical protein
MGSKANSVLCFWQVVASLGNMNKLLSGLLLSSLLSFAWAQTPKIFQDADLKLGEKLIAENKCTECHASKVVGDGSAIYKPKGRVNAPGVLRGMVEQCNTELNMGLFPEEVTAIAAVLNRDYYRFK